VIISDLTFKASKLLVTSKALGLAPLSERSNHCGNAGDFPSVLGGKNYFLFLKHFSAQNITQIGILLGVPYHGPYMLFDF